jgi:cytochrome bd-type quinol oxidase subunit 2
VLATAAAAAAASVLGRANQADLVTALHYQVPRIFLLADQAKAITAAQPAVLMPALLHFGVVVVVAAPAMQLNALAVIASTVVMALLPIPVLPAQCRVVVAVDRKQPQLPVVLAVLAFVSSTSGDDYGLRNR